MLRKTRFKCPWATSVIVFPSPPTITELWSSLVSVSCSHQGPHQGMPLLNVCPTLRGHHQINKINKSNSWQNWSKDSMLKPHGQLQVGIKSKHRWGHMKIRDTNSLSSDGQRKQKGQWRGWRKEWKKRREVCASFLNCILASYLSRKNCGHTFGVKTKFLAGYTQRQVALFTTAHQKRQTVYSYRGKSPNSALEVTPRAALQDILDTNTWCSLPHWYMYIPSLLLILLEDNCVIQTEHLRIK